MMYYCARFIGAPNRRALVAVTLLFCLMLLLAQDTIARSSRLLTLAEAIQHTLAQNPRLAVYRLRDSALVGEAQSAALRPPAYLGAELENFAGTNGAEAAELTVSLSSVIELGGKREARISRVEAARALLMAEEQAEALTLMGEVLRRYTDVLAAKERLALADDAVSLARETLSAVDRRVDAAAAPKSERLRAQAALAEARLSLQSESRQLQVRKRALATLWGSPDDDFYVDSAALYKLPPIAGFEELYAAAEHNPAIAKFASKERLRAAELRLVETQSSLDLAWSVGLRQSRELDETTLVAGVEVPLFSDRRNAGARVAAEAERAQVALERETALLQLNTQLFRAVSGREQAVTTVNVLQQSIVPALESALAEVERAYRRGRYSYLEWIAARDELLQARRARIDAARAALRFGADIEQLTAAPALPMSAPSDSK